VTVSRRAIIAAGIGGAGLLGASLSSPPGSRRFYLLTTGLAGTWTAGALGSGALRSGRLDEQRRERSHGLAVPVLAGACAFGLCYGAASIARHVPPLDRGIRGALRYEHDGSTPLVLLIASANAVAEELFFRGALWALVTDSHPVVTTTLAYTPPSPPRRATPRLCSPAPPPACSSACSVAALAAPLPRRSAT
jgi:hypothetical protein